MGKFAGLVEYDGRDFAGWAAQPGLRTVEETLTGALGTVLRQPIKLTVAGRTDAGVHASGQTVSFGAETELDPSSISYKATAVLPEDLATGDGVPRLAVEHGVETAEDHRMAEAREHLPFLSQSPQRPLVLGGTLRGLGFLAAQLFFQAHFFLDLFLFGDILENSDEAYQLFTGVAQRREREPDLLLCALRRYEW